MSSPLTPEAVQRLARLARLELDPAEVPQIAEGLGRILAYVQQLQEVDTSQVEATAHVQAGDMPLREDAPAPSLPREVALSQAPSRAEDGFIVPTFVGDLPVRDILSRSITAIADLVRRGEVSAVEVAKASIEAIEAQNGDLGAYLEVASQGAIAQAQAVDEARARGEVPGALCGVPIGIKDALCTRDMPTTAGSKILSSRGKGWQPPYDATSVARLRAQGAVLVGKCNMDEFAMGSSNENSAYFVAKNPVDRTRVPGGSSGGSAVSVAAAMTPGAIGSDTGGSVRQPAAFTGVVGVKPTYGRVSRYGLIAYASSLDVVGPLATDVRGAARLLAAMAGHDMADATSAREPVGDYEGACDRGIKGLRVGVPSEYFAEGLDPRVEASVRGALARLEREGAELVPISLPMTPYAVATYYVLATAEASSNLSRFDGVRFGHRADATGDRLDALYERSRGQGFGAEVRRRIILGTYVLSHGYYDAYYLKAQKVRTLLRRELEAALSSQVDVIAAPTAPTPAYKLGEKIADPLTMYLGDIYTLPASLSGLPALSVPVAPTPPDGDTPSLPVGLQLIGRAFAEERLFAVAANVERLERRAGPAA